MSSILKSFRVHLSREWAVNGHVDGVVREDRGAEAGPAANLPRAAEGKPSPDPAQEYEDARAQGYQEGFALGRSEGQARSQQEAQDLLATARGILAEVTAWKQRQLGAELPNVVALATAIAERIVRQAVALDREVVVRALDEAVRQREARDLVRIAVNPAEVETVQAYWQRAHPGHGEVEIDADPSVGPGGCLLLSQSSLIDALVETQLDVIRLDLRTHGASDEQTADGEQ